jgi:hypothetical protein
VESTALTEEGHDELLLLVEDLNDKMRSSGAGGSERAFGLGCAMGLLPVIGIILLLFVFQVINLVLAMFLLVIGLLGVAGISALLASLARTNTHKRIFREVGDPEIVQFISEHHLSRQTFDTLAHQSLPEDAPLQAFLSLATSENNGLPEGS